MYAVRRATPEEKHHLLESLSSCKTKSGKVIPGVVKYTNASHDENPVF